MAWTAKQIYDLDNSMVAAQNVSLGTFLSGSVVNRLVISGSIVPTSGLEVFASGLTNVTNVTCSLSGSPTLNHMFSTATAGSTAGTIVIYSYKPTSASVVTPVAATTGFSNVNWVAVGN